MVALAATAVLGVVALIQRNDARHQAAIARSRELALSSTSQLAIDPERSMLLAKEAVAAAPTAQADNALRQAVFTSRVRTAVPLEAGQIGGLINAVAFSPNGKYVAAALKNGTVSVASSTADQGDRATALPLGTISADDLCSQFVSAAGQVSVVFSPDSRLVAAVNDAGTIHIWRWPRAGKPTTSPFCLGRTTAPDTADVLAGVHGQAWEAPCSDVRRERHSRDRRAGRPGVALAVEDRAEARAPRSSRRRDLGSGVLRGGARDGDRQPDRHRRAGRRRPSPTVVGARSLRRGAERRRADGGCRERPPARRLVTQSQGLSDRAHDAGRDPLGRGQPRRVVRRRRRRGTRGSRLGPVTRKTAGGPQRIPGLRDRRRIQRRRPSARERRRRRHAARVGLGREQPAGASRDSTASDEAFSSRRTSVCSRSTRPTAGEPGSKPRAACGGSTACSNPPTYP